MRINFVTGVTVLEFRKYRTFHMALFIFACPRVELNSEVIPACKPVLQDVMYFNLIVVNNLETRKSKYTIIMNSI